MKKLLSLILVLMLVLSLCACGTGDVNENTDGSSVNTTEDKLPVDSGESAEESTGTTEKKPSRVPTENLYPDLPASCEHGYSDATCTKPKICGICGHELGDPLGHDFVNGSCTRCGEAE